MRSRFRDYQPDLGRFCQPDPLGYIDGMNLYAYCGNNPLNWIDPWGLVPFDPELVFPIDVEPAYEALISFGRYLALGLRRGAIVTRIDQLKRKAQKLYMRSQIFEGLSSMFYTIDEWHEYPGPYVGNVEPYETTFSFYMMVSSTFPWDDLSEGCFEKSLDYDKKIEHILEEINDLEQILEEIRDLMNPDKDSETKSETVE